MFVFQHLRFRLTPISINYWVELMLQFICVDDSTAEDSLIVPQFPQNLFNQVAHLLDLASLDSNSLRYSYSELAASALTIVLNKKIALTISGKLSIQYFLLIDLSVVLKQYFGFIIGLSEGNVCNCVEWMAVYWSVILEEYQYEEIDFENDSEQVDGTHVKQQHLVSMDIYVSIVETTFFPHCSITRFLYLFNFYFALKHRKGWYYIALLNNSVCEVLSSKDH